MEYKRLPTNIEQIIDSLGVDHQFLTVNGIHIFLAEKGYGKPIFLVHGYNSCFHTWRHNVLPLSKHFRVIVFDLPGFGLSGNLTDFPFTLNGYADFVKELFAELGVKKAGFVGHSLGGLIGLAMCMADHNLIRNLVLIGTPRLNNLQYSKKALSNLLLFSYYDTSLIKNELIEIYQYISSSLKQRPPEMEQIINNSNFPKKHPKSSVPCLSINGEDDLVLPKKSYLDVNQYFSDTTKMVIPQCGHAPHEEKASMVNDLILQAFSKQIK